jgi:hypothetical protein
MAPDSSAQELVILLQPGTEQTEQPALAVTLEEALSGLRSGQQPPALGSASVYSTNVIFSVKFFVAYV